MITTRLKRLTRNPLIREGSLLLCLYWLYSSIRWFVARNSPYEAFSNAYKVIQLETQLGIFHEPAIQKWFVNHALGLVRLANNFYTVGYFPFLILTGVLLYWYDQDRFHVFRLTFLLGLGFALVCFSLFPLAPPRMLPEVGFVDTQQIYGDGFYNRKIALSFYNPYAAMPSLHFGWALLVGMTAYHSRRRILMLLGVLYPSCMAFTIVTTGHHYFLDIVGGGGVVGLAYTLVRAFPYLAKELTANPANNVNRNISYKQSSTRPRLASRRASPKYPNRLQDRLERVKTQVLHYTNHLTK